MIFAEWILWISIILIGWTYLGYPILLSFLARFKSSVHVELEEYPEIDVLFAAYNEESVIEAKIHSIYKTSYPLEKINVYIGSDASSDRTDDIISKLQKEYPRLHLIRMTGRTGKSGIINHLVEASSAPVILGTDANIFFTENMISELVKHIRGDVHLVGGNIVYRDTRKEGIAPEEHLYLSFENKIKERESLLWNLVIGVEGGCYCMRRDAFTQIPELTYMEDFFLTMAVLKKHGKVHFEAKAICTEDVSIDREEEFKRKVRISLGNYQNLRRFWSLIITRFWPVGFAFLSHKVLRWATPILLIITFLSTLYLSLFTSSGIYKALFSAQLFTTILFIVNQVVPGSKKRSSVLRFVGHFYLMNFALLKGLMIYLQGVDTNVWQPTKRAQKRS